MFLADWLVASMLALRQGSLGHLRLTIKNNMEYFPFFGFYWRMVSLKHN